MDKLPLHKRIHFVGIGGAGMSPIARILLQLGYSVSGSDLKESINTIRLKDLGAKIYYGHDVSQLRAVDVVVVSTAIPPTNEEFAYATQENMVVYRRAEMLGLLMQGFSKKISVAGTHGKTTTSSMIARMFVELHKNPTFLVGSEIMDMGTNAELGGKEYFVAESDESDGSFLCLEPNVAVLTNMEPEHMDYYKTESNLIDHFRRFMSGVLNRDGYLVVNRDDAPIYDLSQVFDSERVVTFGIDQPSDVMATRIEASASGFHFDVVVRDEVKGRVTFSLVGLHNVYNALASLAVAYAENADMGLAIEGVSRFTGTKRRMQLLGERQGVSVFDDYGHHSTEISTTLEGAKKAFDRRVVCIFQPHRYSRTRDQMDDYVQCFDAADVVIITDVYAAGEAPIDGVNSQVLVDKIRARNPEFDVEYIGNKSMVFARLFSCLRAGDVVITMGAGDVYTVGQELYNQLSLKSVASGNDVAGD